MITESLLIDRIGLAVHSFEVFERKIAIPIHTHSEKDSAFIHTTLLTIVVHS
jgi:hypothetical protein